MDGGRITEVVTATSKPVMAGLALLQRGLRVLARDPRTDASRRNPVASSPSAADFVGGSGPPRSRP